MSLITKTIYFLLSSFLCVSCQTRKTEEKPLILVSISPYSVFIDKITEGFAEVKAIVPENQNPHFFTPSIKQISKMDRAKAIFLIGEAFEEKILPSLIDKNPELRIVNLQNNISLIPIEKCTEQECSHGHFDIHLWLSPLVVIKQLAQIEKDLVDIFPEEKALINKRTQNLRAELENLDKTLKNLSLKNKRFLTSHAAFAYFCRDYGPIELSLEKGQKEASAKYLESLIKITNEKNIDLMVIISHINAQGAERVAKQLEMESITFDPYSKNYFANLTFLAQKISESYE